MMNKKNMAVAMAAVTMATSVAPVFAATAVKKETIERGSKEADKLVDEVRDLLAKGKKYTDKNDAEYGQSVYKITVNGSEVKNAFELETKIEEMTKNTEIKVEIIEKANVTLNGEVKVPLVADTYKEADLATLAATIQGTVLTGTYTNVDAAAATPETLSAEYTGSGATSKVTMFIDKDDNDTFDSGEEKISEILVGTNKLDLTKEIKKSDGSFGGFEDVAATIKSTKETVLAEITVEYNVEDKNTHSLKLADLYDGEFLTEKGLELLDVLQGGADVPGKYEIKSTTTPVSINADKDALELKLTVDYVNSTKKDVVHTVKIKSSDLGYLTELKDILNKKSSYEVSKLAGDSRFSTAVEVAEKLNANPTEIVIVNEVSMIDGLTAAPYAKDKNAPVLLTKTNSIPEETMKYIKDNKDSNLTKVTVIGGTSAVSKDVVEELQDLGLKVNRIGGKDRHETSVLVAKEIGTFDKAYVVASTGEADAMTIAPIAADKTIAAHNNAVAPIIVEGFDGISEFGKKELKGKEIDVIGAGVTEDTLEVLDNLNGDDKIVKVAGKDRFETNAKIIKKYYSDVEKVYVAKDSYNGKNNEELVDALAAGPLAAGKGPIVLATKKLTTEQEEALELVKKDQLSNEEVVQVGNGVAHSVVKSLAKIFKITK